MLPITLTNPDASAVITTGWTVTAGTINWATGGGPSVPASRPSYWYSVTTSSAHQTVTLDATQLATVATGTARLWLTYWRYKWATAGMVGIQLLALDDTDTVLSTVYDDYASPATAQTWLQVLEQSSDVLPTGTTKVRVVQMYAVDAGIDDISLVLRSPDVSAQTDAVYGSEVTLHSVVTGVDQVYGSEVTLHSVVTGVDYIYGTEVLIFGSAQQKPSVLLINIIEYRDRGSP